MTGYPGHAIAVIGMAGRFPGASGVDQFWDNIVAGRDTISRFGPDELRAAGVPAGLLDTDRYVGARGVLPDADQFDAGFFGMSPREAAITDPQHRVFLEAAWEALENAGHAPGRGDDLVGVYAAAGPTAYLTNNVSALRGSDVNGLAVNGLEALLGNDKDYLASRVAYKLDLRGPAMSVQTACSSSLVAVCLASQALLAFECDLALAGGVHIRVPQISGYSWQHGGIMSRDGVCRPFDAAANGTVLANAVGVLVLRRLDEAIDAGDHIAAVITGYAVTNDGAQKVGFTAPGVDGQRRAILLAQARAGRTGADIGYVETHGTGTELGDAIELTALTEAFRATTQDTGFCDLGGVKANIGHADTAAGAAGLIKTVLAVRAGVVPPLAHFTEPTAHLAAATPFRVPTAPRAWAGPRRAGVSSFGIGGTNAHVIVEQAPPAPDRPPVRRPAELLVLSARTPAALRESTRRLSAALRETRTALADVAYTLALGRVEHEHRWSAACVDPADALARLAEPAAPAPGPAPVTFLFPGGGAQYPGMAAELHATQHAFRTAFDECADAAASRLGIDIRTPALLPPTEPGDLTVLADLCASSLAGGELGLPALFATEYALARLFMAWGVTPAVLCGHSLGEYTAATLAGVFTVPDAVELVGMRGRLLDKAAGGAMLAVRLAPGPLAALLPADLSIAAHNGPTSCVVSGPAPALTALQRRLTDIGVQQRPVPIAVAAHSALVEPVLAEFAAVVAGMPRHAPTIPVVSNRTGGWLCAAEATSVDYWVGHLRDTVRFADGLDTVAGSGATVLLELGPGHTLTELVKARPGAPLSALCTLPARAEPQHPLAGVLSALGRLWQAGHPIDWDAVYTGRQLRRVELPTYPWQHRRFWIDVTPADGPGRAGDTASLALAEEPDEPVGSWDSVGSGESVGSVGSGLAVEVAAEWFAILGVAVAPQDNFFELGGQSLAGLRLVNRLADRFGVPLALRTLFDNPTVALLSAVIDALRRAPDATTHPATAHPAVAHPATNHPAAAREGDARQDAVRQGAVRVAATREDAAAREDKEQT